MAPSPAALSRTQVDILVHRHAVVGAIGNRLKCFRKRGLAKRDIRRRVRNLHALRGTALVHVAQRVTFDQSSSLAGLPSSDRRWPPSRGSWTKHRAHAAVRGGLGLQAGHVIADAVFRLAGV